MQFREHMIIGIGRLCMFRNKVTYGYIKIHFIIYIVIRNDSYLFEWVWYDILYSLSNNMNNLIN